MQVTRALRLMLLAAILLCGLVGFHIAEHRGTVKAPPGQAQPAPLITAVAQSRSFTDGAERSSPLGEPHGPAGEACGIPTRLVAHPAGSLMDVTTAISPSGLDNAAANAEAAGPSRRGSGPQLGLHLADLAVCRR